MVEEGTGKIEVFQMNQLTFEDGASPFVAMTTLERTAGDCGGSNDRAITAIKDNYWITIWMALTLLRKLSGWEAR